MKLLNGNELAGFIKERQAKEVRRLAQAYAVVPKLAIVQVKNDPVINTYVKLKKQYGADIGAAVDIHFVAQEATEETIERLNNDIEVHGIIVQLPLNDVSETDKICNLVSPDKDVDALGDPEAPWPTHLSDPQGASERRTEPYQKYAEGAVGQATQRIAKTGDRLSGFAGKQVGGVRGLWFDPATPTAILWLLAGYNIDIKNKKILLIGRGKLVGAPLEKMLKTAGHNVEVADRETKDLKQISLSSDIIITAAGSPALLFSDMIKPGTVIVDAGVASEDGRTVGDVAEEVYGREDLVITPQKGGVGPLTVCALFENLMLAARRTIEGDD